MKQWKSEYIENNIEESHVYLFTSLEIKDYIQKFLRNYGLTLHNYQINFLGSTIDLFISYYQTSKSLSFIQKTNIDQKIRIKKKRFSRKLQIDNRKHSSFIESTQHLKSQIKNYYLKNNTFVERKILRILNALEILKLEYYSLKSSKKTNVYFKEKKKILFHYYINYFKYRRYISFLVITKKVKKNQQRRVQALKYYKTYLNLSEYRTLHNIQQNSFVEKLVEGLTLFTTNRFNIFITIQQINRNIKFPKQSSQNLKRILSKLRKFQRNDFFSEGINILFNAISQKNSAELITDYIAYQLKFIKRHKFFLTFVTKTLTLLINQKFSKVNGIKLKVKGRINNSSRAKSQTINIGKISLITVNPKISHAESTSYGPNGTFGIQVWISTN